MAKLTSLFCKEPAVIIGALITLVQAIAPGNTRAIALLTFVGAVMIRQTVFSPASVAALKAGGPPPESNDQIPQGPA